MTYTKEGDPGKGGHGGYVWKPNREYMTKPEVEPVPHKVKGQMLYHGTGKDKGRTFIAEAFERTWSTPGGKVKPLHTKGRIEKIMT